MDTPTGYMKSPNIVRKLVISATSIEPLLIVLLSTRNFLADLFGALVGLLSTCWGTYGFNFILSVNHFSPNMGNLRKNG